MSDDYITKTDQNSTENKTEQTRSADHEIDCSRITRWWASNQLFEWMLKDYGTQFSYCIEPNQSDKQDTKQGTKLTTNQLIYCTQTEGTKH
jgi:hypothetical protein